MQRACAQGKVKVYTATSGVLIGWASTVQNTEPLAFNGDLRVQELLDTPAHLWVRMATDEELAENPSEVVKPAPYQPRSFIFSDASISYPDDLVGSRGTVITAYPEKEDRVYSEIEPAELSGIDTPPTPDPSTNRDRILIRQRDDRTVHIC